MASRRSSQTPESLADDGSSDLLLEVGRTIRDNLHVLCALSLAFLVVALPWVILATLTSWAVAWAPLMLCTSPAWAVIVASADRLLAGEVVTRRMLVRDFRHATLPAIRIGILPAVCGTVLWVVANSPTDTWWKAMVLPLAAGAAATVFVLVIPAVPLAIRLNITGLTLWQASAVVVVRRPMQVLGSVVIAGAGLWLSLAFGPAVLLGAAPLGVLIAAITLPDPD